MIHSDSLVGDAGRTPSLLPPGFPLLRVLLLLLLVGILAAMFAPSPRRPFDAALWRDLRAQRSMGAPLEEMARTLEHDRALLGKSREQVLALLGPPDDMGGARGIFEPLTWVLDESPVSWTVTVLEVYFDETGRCIRVDLWSKGS
ncbi:MAG: outer membrane protein assembly factor BamE [Planctomycetes bacterium]|nr:outer membrane protein assembly factor BamE [Planctomycetota bacterium]